MATAYSSLHQAKPPRIPQPSKHRSKPKPIQASLQPPLSAPLLSSAPANMVSKPNMDAEPPMTARTTSLAGRKRPRESEGAETKVIPRRTKSVGAPLDVKAKDREAFQRGLIAVFVPKALEESARGMSGNYNDLLASFLPTPMAPTPLLPPLLPLIRSLTANVNLLSPILHGALITAILDLPWAAAEERFVKAYIGWAGVLISAHPDWAKAVVAMAVKGLTWQYPLQSTSAPSPVTRRISHARHHLLITHLLALIPTLPNLLSPLLIRHFPHKREREVAQVTYLRNICEVAEYCPELNTRIWDQAIDRLLRIDVEITRAGEADDADDDEEEDEEERLEEMCKASRISGDPWDLKVTEDIPPDPTIRERKDEDEGDDNDELDMDALSSEDEGGSDSEGRPDAAKEAIARAKRKLHLILMRRKLDGMLVYFFRHLEESMGYRRVSPPATELAASTLTAASSGRSTPAGSDTTLPTPPINAIVRRTTRSPAQSLSAFQTLLNLFSRQILPTSATQHIPFLLFLCASFSPSHTDLFLGLLVSHSLYGGTTSASSGALSQPVSLNQRIAATVYIGSIVCRARFVTDDQARQVMTYLLAYIEGKMQQAKLSAKVDELPLFYAVCQAVMLIFCFRWRAFLASDREDEVVGEMELEGDEGGVGEGGKWIPELEVLQRALTSELNPLLGCNPTIVQTFAKVAHQTNFAYCYSILETNASAARSSSSHSLTSLARPAQSAFSRTLSTPNSATPSGSIPFGNFRRPNPAHATSSSSSVTPANLAIPRIARQSNIDAGLDSYFPFDPFDLSRSGERVEAIYRTWKEVAVDAGENSDSDSDDDDDESVEGGSDSGSDDEEMGESPLSDHLSPKMIIRQTPLGKAKNQLATSADRRRAVKDGGLSSSFDGMSISPRFTSLAGQKGPSK